MQERTKRQDSLGETHKFPAESRRERRPFQGPDYLRPRIQALF